MNRPFSLYLDGLRFCAAVLVVLAHYAQQGFIVAPARHMADFGREAVIIFFVLSGLVIAYTCEVRKASLQEYVAARCARMYATVVPVLLLAFLLAALVAALDGPLAYQLLKPHLYLPLHLLFMGELWNLAETPPYLAPYWSLGYEAWYYALFGIVFYLRGRRRILLGALTLLIMGPKLWLLLPVWLAGVWCYRHQDCLQLTPLQARLGCVLTVAILIAWKWCGIDIALRAAGSALWPFPALHLGTADRFLADYIVCALVCLHFLCARRASLTALERWAAPVRTLAGYSFTLYLVHGLVLAGWARYYRHDPASVTDIALLTFCIGLATVTIGNFTERRKPAFQQRLNVVFGTQRT